MKKIFFCTALLALSNLAFAGSKGENQAQAFQKIYLETCIQYLTHLNDLRKKLNDLPSLPPESAKQFLKDKKGRAWPIPGQPGDYVLVLEDDKNFCAVYARKLDVESAKQTFIENYKKPSSDKLVAEKVLDEKDGERHSISYNWFKPKATRKLNFMLTVSEVKSTNIQALFTASIIGDKP